MIRQTVLVWSLLLILPAAAFAIDLKELVRQVEQQYNGNSSHARADMKVKTEHWQRNMTLEAWSLGRDHFLTRIQAPPKEKGVSTLKVNKEVWNYMPRVDRVIKVPPSMMGGAWMGSHITNDDLVKATHVDLDYDLTLAGETETQWRISCLPKPDVPVVWGKIVYAIRKADRVPLKVEYFDENMVKVREIRFDDVQSVENRAIPMRMTVQPLDKPGEQTVLHYQEIDYDIPIKESYFSLRNLKKR
jgi:hypothetical protein